MPVQRLNHAVLYVRDVERSSAFYRDVLGFRAKMEMPGAVFLQAEGSSNDHDLGLFAIGPEAGAPSAGHSTVGLYHLAWEVDTLVELARIRDALLQAGALVGASDHGTTKALYAQDPDGIGRRTDGLTGHCFLQTPCAGMTRIRFEGLLCPALSAPRRSPVGFFCCAAKLRPLPRGTKSDAGIVETSCRIGGG